MKKIIVGLVLVLVIFSFMGCAKKKVNPLVGKYRIEGISKEDKLAVGFMTREENLDKTWKPNIYTTLVIREYKENGKVVLGSGWINQSVKEDADIEMSELKLDNAGIYTFDYPKIKAKLVNGTFEGILDNSLLFMQKEYMSGIEDIINPCKIKLVKIED